MGFGIEKINDPSAHIGGTLWKIDVSKKDISSYQKNEDRYLQN